jgi:hypothetical protein
LAAQDQKQLTQDLLPIPRDESPPDRNCETLTGVFIDDRPQIQRSAILRALHHEIIRPDMVWICWSLADAGAIGQSEPGSFGLFLRHLQAFLPPDPFHAFVIHPPPLLV